MKSVSNYFIPPFEDIRVGKPEILKFFEDHTDRVTKSVAEGEPFAALVAPTRTCFEKLRASLGNTATNYAQQQAATITVKDIIVEFKAKVINTEPYILIHYNKKSNVYQQFYPYGLKQYHFIYRNNATILMTQFKQAAYNNIGVLGQQLFDDIEDIFNRYTAAHSAQNQMKESTSMQRNEWDENLAMMKDQVFDNILAIARVYRGKPEITHRFFTQSILRLRKHKAETDAKIIQQ